MNVAGNGDIHELVNGGVVLMEEGVQVGGGAGAEERVALQAHLEFGVIAIQSSSKSNSLNLLRTWAERSDDDNDKIQ